RFLGPLRSTLPSAGGRSQGLGRSVGALWTPCLSVVASTGGRAAGGGGFSFAPLRTPSARGRSGVGGRVGDGALTLRARERTPCAPDLPVLLGGSLRRALGRRVGRAVPLRTSRGTAALPRPGACGHAPLRSTAHPPRASELVAGSGPCAAPSALC